MRGSGKTTQMIEDALRLAYQGEYVFVVAANLFHLRQLREMIFARDPLTEISEQLNKIYIGFNGGSITLTHIGDRHVDLYFGRYTGAYPSCVFLADHLTLECYLELNWAYRTLRDYYG